MIRKVIGKMCNWRGDWQFDLRCEMNDLREIQLAISFDMCDLRDMRLERYMIGDMCNLIGKVI